MKSSHSLKILQVAPELTPYAKVGGLADVVGALTKEMSRRGHDVRVLIPKYGSLRINGDCNPLPGVFYVHLGWQREAYARLWQTDYPKSDAKVFFLEYEKYYGRHEIYTGPWGGHQDNNERFTFLSRAAIEFCHQQQWYPDIIHCHDWPTGLVPVYLNATERATPLLKAASVFTIHNMQHQGMFGRETLDFAGLPSWLFTPDNLEALGNVNMMKGALYHSTKLTTVSPNYAKEIQTPEGGFGLDPVLRFRAGDLIGVTNGIDTEEWNPATDPLIPARYSVDDMSGKAICKETLQQEFGLEVDPNVPVFGVVARLFDQKGLDLLAEIVPSLMSDMRIQIVLLGAGDPALENAFRHLSYQYARRVGCYIGYNNRLAHLVEAGSDFFIMPSRFEPCGLNQLYSMAYGTLPIVRKTGGLVDTVQQYREGTSEGTGFLFEEASGRALYYTIGWACATYYDRRGDFETLRKNAMSQDLSWAKASETYEKVYQWAIEARLSGLGMRPS